jgi:hypothetical protein
MAHYMVKTYDDAGRLVDRLEFAAPDDRQAEDAAGDLHPQQTQELWCGRRWVRTWPALTKVA